VALKAAEFVERPSLKTKAASLLGAALGTDVIGKLTKQPPTSDAAKSFLRDVIAKKQDELRKIFVAAADNWIEEKLSLYVLVGVVDHRECEQHGRLQVSEAELWDLLTDDVAQEYMSKVANINDLYLYTAKNFLFPGVDFVGDVDFDGAKLNFPLRKFMVTEINQALREFNRQFKDWNKARSHANPLISARSLFQMSTQHPVNLRVEFERKHPFRPSLKFMGLPNSVQQAKRTDVGDIVVKWKYKS
jgi:hypothetical protein